LILAALFFFFFLFLTLPCSNVPHRQEVFVIPKMPRIFFKFKRKLFGYLCRCAERLGKLHDPA